MAKPRFGTFAEVASELGVEIDSLINEVLDKKRVVIGYNCESSKIEQVPWEYFAIDRRSNAPPAAGPLIDDATRDVLSKLYPELDWNDPEIVRSFDGGIRWIDPDYDERTGEPLLANVDVYPPTCLDCGERTIFIDGQRRWINLKISWSKDSQREGLSVAEGVTAPSPKGGEDQATIKGERKPKEAPKRGQIRTAILNDLQSGKTTPGQLSGLPRKVLIDRYGDGAGRTTVVHAMEEACRDWESRQIATNDNS
jgi:hypothetical protein